MLPVPSPDVHIVVLSGAGLSKASGIPTFRDDDGLWRGHRFQDLATPEAWHQDAERVRTFYDVRRENVESVEPNAGHHALVRLQQAWGPERVTLVTQNVDGMLQRAGAPQVLEMHGSLLRLRCEADPHHPEVHVSGPQTRTTPCARCGARLRPAVVWFGEVPHHLEEIQERLVRCRVFLSIGTSGVVYPAAGFVRLAEQVGARSIEINPVPSGAHFDDVIAEGSETALPRLVSAWLDA